MSGSKRPIRWPSGGHCAGIDEMAVLFDTSVILLAIHPDASPPIDPATKQTVDHARQRVEYLIRKLSKARTKVVIPSPVLALIVNGVCWGSSCSELLPNL